MFCQTPHTFKPTSITIDGDTLTMLDRVCVADATSRSEIVRRALRAYGASLGFWPVQSNEKSPAAAGQGSGDHDATQAA